MALNASSLNKPSIAQPKNIFDKLQEVKKLSQELLNQGYKKLLNGLNINPKHFDSPKEGQQIEICDGEFYINLINDNSAILLGKFSDNVDVKTKAQVIEAHNYGSFMVYQEEKLILQVGSMDNRITTIRNETGRTTQQIREIGYKIKEFTPEIQPAAKESKKKEIKKLDIPPRFTLVSDFVSRQDDNKLPNMMEMNHALESILDDIRIHNGYDRDYVILKIFMKAKRNNVGLKELNTYMLKVLLKAGITGKEEPEELAKKNAYNYTLIQEYSGVVSRALNKKGLLAKI
jgi:hypothetical protein